MEFLVIDDDKTFREAVCCLIEDEGHSAEGAPSGETALTRLREDEFDAALLDLRLGNDNGLDLLVEIQKSRPNLPVVMVSAQGSVRDAVEAMRRGAMDFLEKPFLRDQFLAVLSRVNRFRHLGRQIETLEREVQESRSQQGEPLFDFSAPAMREVMDILHRAAPTPVSILILGESGTGKSVAARAVHEASHLADKPFVTVSCPSLSRELLESELFGHVKGAFTGAVRDHWGKVRVAEGGTLFLDEIGDLPLEVQPKLLRLLQEREYERLGENVVRRVNVRILAATNRDLERRVAEGAFREDLFFRLNVITALMPPLRERQSDVIRFAEHYLSHFARQCGRRIQGFTTEAAARLASHTWPGNLRELRNAVERAVIMARDEQVAASDLPGLVAPANRVDQPASPAESAGLTSGTRLSLAHLEEAHIRHVLAQCQSLVEAAEVLGIDQATLYRKRKKLGLP